MDDDVAAADASPLIVVCLAPADLRPDVNPVTGEVARDERAWSLNPAESAALEYGLRAAEAWGGSVLTLAVGPAPMDDTLRMAEGVGSRPLRISLDESRDGSAVSLRSDGVAGRSAAVAVALSEAIRAAGPPALVVCGDRSSRAGTASVPAYLARHLDVPGALGMISLRFNASPRGIRGDRRLDGGWKEELEVCGPCVVSVEAAGVRLRRASVAAALAASTSTIAVRQASRPAPSLVRLTALRPYRPRTRAVAPPAGDTHERLLALTGAFSRREPPRMFGPASAAAAADELLAHLSRHGYR